MPGLHSGCSHCKGRQGSFAKTSVGCSAELRSQCDHARLRMNLRGTVLLLQYDVPDGSHTGCPDRLRQIRKPARLWRRVDHVRLCEMLCL